MMLYSIVVLFFIVFVKIIESKPADYEAKYGGYVIEGDMILPMKTLEIIEAEGDVTPPLKDKEREDGKPLSLGVTAHDRYRWVNGIVPYEISNGLKCSRYFWKCAFYGAEDVINNAIKAWERSTCIRFVKRTNQRDYIRFIDDGIGKCYSHVGRTGGAQVVALGKFCRKTGIAIHEIGHALGFFHEQSRPDRDKYVIIHKDKIKSGAKLNFQKYKQSQVNDLGFPYDYDSIMHYGAHAFADWPWQTTIEPRQRGKKIGQRNGLSQGDIAEMRKYYRC